MGRSQRTRVNGDLSNSNRVKCGGPLCSVMGLFFNMFIDSVFRPRL